MKQVRWIIIGLLATGLLTRGAAARAQENVPPPAQPSDAGDTKPTPGLFERLQKRGIHLGRAIQLDRLQDILEARDDPASQEAAEFSFLDASGEKSVFSVDFALWKDFTEAKSLIRPNGPRGSRLLRSLGFATGTPEVSVEGHLSSDDADSEDAWRFRASLALDGILSESGSYAALLSVKHESDRDFRTQKLMGELLFTPTLFRLGIGKAMPVTKGVLYRLRPFFGVDAGTTLRRGDSTERKDTVLRLLLRGKAELFLTGVAQQLGLKDIFFFVDDTLYHLPLEDTGGKHNLVVAGLEFRFNDYVSFGLTYKNGETSPDFERVKTFAGTVGVRF